MRITNCSLTFLRRIIPTTNPSLPLSLELEGEICGYFSAHGGRCFNQLYSFQQNVVLFLPRVAALSAATIDCSRRFIRWMVSHGWREVPAAPRANPHFHINLLPEARKISTTRALISAYFSYLYRCGEKRVYGQIVTFESRRGEKMFERYGFKVSIAPRSRNTKRSIRSRFTSARSSRISKRRNRFRLTFAFALVAARLSQTVLRYNARVIAGIAQLVEQLICKHLPGNFRPVTEYATESWSAISLALRHFV